MHTWDVVILRYPFTDGQGTKQRPAIVVSKDTYHSTGQDGLFLLVTSNTSRLYEYDIIIPETHPEFARSGLVKASAIRVDKVMNLTNTLVCRQIGHLGPTLKAAVREKLSDLWDI